MSNDLFPALLGVQWDIKKTPLFSTLIQRVVSGGEYRAATRIYPLWEFAFTYDLLRDDLVTNELQTLMGFYLSHRGAANSFLYSDPDDNIVTGQMIGIGDAGTAAFQLIRTYGGFAEPIYDIATPGPVVDPELILNGVFSSDTSNWTAVDCTLASINGGQAGKCLELTKSGGTIQDAYQNITTAIGQTYEASVYVQSGSAGAGAFEFQAWDATDGYRTTSGTSSASWVKYTLTFKAIETTTKILLVKNNIAAGTMLFDTVSVKKLNPAFLNVYVSGILIDPQYYTVGMYESGLLTFAAGHIPALYAPITADFSFYYRVRFEEWAEQTSDSFNQFMHKLWNLGQLSFITAR
jgi:hypothetical protein